MMETALPKCLKLLRGSFQPLSEEEIAAAIAEGRLYVAKALEKLTEKSVVVKEGQSYRYQKTAANEKFCARLLSVYDTLVTQSELEFLIVAFLSTAAEYEYLLGRSALLDALEKEGYHAEQVGTLLGNQFQEGRIEKMKMAIKMEKDEPVVPPAAIPWHYTSNFIPVGEQDYENLKSSWAGEGLSIQEEEYLTGNFPQEMIMLARDHLATEMPRIQRNIIEEASASKMPIWWFHSRTIWRHL